MNHQIETWYRLYHQLTQFSWEQLLEEPELRETCHSLKLTFPFQTLRLWWQFLQLVEYESITYSCKMNHFRDFSTLPCSKADIFTFFFLLVNHSGLFSLQLFSQKFRMNTKSLWFLTARLTYKEMITSLPNLLKMIFSLSHIFYIKMFI